MEILQGVWKQHIRPRAVVGYGVKIFSSQSSKLRHQITWLRTPQIACDIETPLHLPKSLYGQRMVVR